MRCGCMKFNIDFGEQSIEYLRYMHFVHFVHEVEGK